MNNELALAVIGSVLTILVAIITTVVLPSIKSLLDSKFTESQLQTALDWANVAVRFAEQTIPEAEWQRKKDDVMKSITEFVNSNLDLTLTPEMLEVLVESCVYDKNVEKKLNSEVV